MRQSLSGMLFAINTMTVNSLSYIYHNRTRFLRLAREGGLVLTGQVISVAGGLVIVRVLTEYLTPKQYGNLH